jgi:hypothetical protein
MTVESAAKSERAARATAADNAKGARSRAHHQRHAQATQRACTASGRLSFHFALRCALCVGETSLTGAVLRLPDAPAEPLGTQARQGKARQQQQTTHNTAQYRHSTRDMSTTLVQGQCDQLDTLPPQAHSGPSSAGGLTHLAWRCCSVFRPQAAGEPSAIVYSVVQCVSPRGPHRREQVACAQGARPRCPRGRARRRCSHRSSAAATATRTNTNTQAARRSGHPTP